MKWLATEVAVAEGVMEAAAEDGVVAEVGEEVTVVRTQHLWVAVVVGRDAPISRFPSTSQDPTFCRGSRIFKIHVSVFRQGVYTIGFHIGAEFAGILDL